MGGTKLALFAADIYWVHKRGGRGSGVCPDRAARVLSARRRSRRREREREREHFLVLPFN